MWISSLMLGLAILIFTTTEAYGSKYCKSPHPGTEDYICKDSESCCDGECCSSGLGFKFALGMFLSALGVPVVLIILSVSCCIVWYLCRRKRTGQGVIHSRANTATDEAVCIPEQITYKSSTTIPLTCKDS